MRVVCALLLAVISAGALEPLPFDQGAVGTRLAIRSLSNPYRVLHVIAHPDDEDSATVTYLSRGLGAEVTIASITRGESGANLITGDFFDGLGVLRTLEFRAAARYYGARLRFTTFADFGYSKTLEETLRNWDQDEVVRDLVRIIREERPHVVLSRFQGNSQDGHGHHQAAGLLAREAYRAAGDSARYPDAGVPWQPLKFYANLRNPDDDWTVRIDSGQYDPLLGMTFAELARMGLRNHRSQGAGSAIASPGPSVRHYRLVASQAGAEARGESFFERLENPMPKQVSAAVADAANKFTDENPSAAIPALLRGLQASRALRREGSSLTLERLVDGFQTAISRAAGLRLSFLVEPEGRPDGPYSSFMPYETLNVATPGSTFTALARLYAGTVEPQAVDIAVEAPEGWSAERIGEGRYRITVPEEGVRSSSVHWKRDSVWDLGYTIADARRWGDPLPAAPLRATARFEIDGVELRVSEPAQASFVDERRIQRRRRLAVGPAVAVSIPTDAGVLPVGAKQYALSVNLSNNSSRAVKGTLRLKMPEGWSAAPESTPFALSKEGAATAQRFTVRPPDTPAPGVYPLRAVAEYDGGRSDASFQRIRAQGLETAHLSRPARHEVRVVDVATVPDLQVGYVEGTGDDVPQAINQLGAQVTLLDAAALASGDHSRFDAILLGIRAYAVREDLKAHNDRLLEYVERGGVVIVQYNTPEFDSNYGPYPYKMTRRPEEVSEEDSPVTILADGDPVFNWPNRIGPGDFDGWVEQRGSKFLVEWDARYTALLETHDTGQDPQRGGWLSARYGDGLYVYCAYAWYRQLPYAVPGAVRIFANLLALGAPDAPWRN